MCLHHSKVRINSKVDLKLSPSHKNCPLCPIRVISYSILYSFKVCSWTVPPWLRVGLRHLYCSKLLVLRKVKRLCSEVRLKTSGLPFSPPRRKHLRPYTNESRQGVQSLLSIHKLHVVKKPALPHHTENVPSAP